MFRYKKFENRRELSSARAWYDKILTKLSLGYDSKSKTTDITGELAYNSMKIGVSHRKNSKKIDGHAKIKKSRSNLIVKGKKFLLNADKRMQNKKIVTAL
ncbi:MAG: hypothetical protein GY821_10785 [Gammaproteobacteria bacterium]|nr:hypothetical protein [Gammaproteobacteria bacterium]